MWLWFRERTGETRAWRPLGAPQWSGGRGVREGDPSPQGREPAKAQLRLREGQHGPSATNNARSAPHQDGYSIPAWLIGRIKLDHVFIVKDLEKV